MGHPADINLKWFKNSFKQKLRDQYIQNWNSLVEKSSSGLNYRIFKNTFEMNYYFSFLPNKYCQLLTAFRTRNHRLPIETGRWSSTPLSERICKLCNLEIGDEFHYILKCSILNDQRMQLVKPFYRVRPNAIKFHSLMNHRNKVVIKNLCKFIEVINMKIREQSG